jgi:shikimate dehydrogenase
VLILGTGGTGVMALAYCKTNKAKEIVVVSRDGENNYRNIERHFDSQVIINTTPVGMYPNNGKRVVCLDSFKKVEGVVDVIYNPLMTLLMLDAKRLGVKYQSGLAMLVMQAKLARDLFLENIAPDKEFLRIYNSLVLSVSNIVLIGMPSCGKSSVGHELAKVSDRPFVDSDQIIALREGRSIPQIFAESGENYFRKVEAEVIADLTKEKGQIISVGGGAVMTDGAYESLKQNGIIVYLTRDLSKADTKGRPLLMEDGALEKLYRLRSPTYNAFADIIVDNNGNIADTVQKVRSAINENFGY